MSTDGIATAPEVTLLPNESKEDFVYVDTQLNLSPRDNVIEATLIDGESLTSEYDVISSPLIDENLKEGVVLNGKRSYEENDLRDEDFLSKKSKGFVLLKENVA